MNVQARLFRKALPELPKSHARRRRDRKNARRAIVHIALPGYEVARETPKPRETVSAFLRRVGWAKLHSKYGWQFRNGLPTILEVNGVPVLRKAWRSTKIAANDNVRFISRPLGGQRGGSGKQILGLVALVAVSAFALWAGPALAAGLGLAGISATVVGGLATAGIAVAGSLLINSLTAPKPGATNDPTASTVDQIYTAQAQGNTAKLGQPLPVGYGREKVFPNFAATPWAEFVGNDQYQNILLDLGMGKYAAEQMLVDDTPFWDPEDGISPAFSSATVAFYLPGEEVDLFPINVVAAAEVTGQSLPDPAVTPWIGGFIVNAAGTIAKALCIDFVFPGGCFTIDGSGNLGASSVTLTAQYRPVNDAGAPIGSFSTLFSVTRTYNSRSPIRDSVKADVPDGRYEVRFQRGNAPLAGTSGTNEVVWAGLRAFLKGNNSFPDSSTIAIRIKGTESTQGSFRFGVLRTRILPVWDNDVGEFVEQPTRSVAWAAYDIATSPQYGAGQQLSKIDFNALLNFDAGCEARGDHFDYTFNAAVPAPEAIDKALTVARARHFWLGDVLSIVRDEWRDVPGMLLTDREIVRGSTQIGWTMLGEEDPDAVIIEYIDEETWRPAQVQYPPNSGEFTATNAETKRIDGVVNRDHAYREAAFYYLQSIYRRENVQLGTEYEGRAITFGSALRVQSELPLSYGAGGEIVELTDLIATLNPAPAWPEDGPYFLRIRRANGKWFGPVVVTQGDDASLAEIDEDDLAAVEIAQGIELTDVLAREDGGERAAFELGSADNQSRVCVVLSGSPSGHQCTLNLVVDDERVHATDIGTPPVLPTAQFPANSRSPDVAFLQAKFRQGIAEPILDASWWPAPGARYYIAEVSYDARTVGNENASWIKIYENSNTLFSQVVDRADLRLRVQATAERSGARSFVDVDAPTIIIAPGTVDSSSMVAGLKDLVTNHFGGTTDQINSVLQLISAVVAQQAGTNQNDKKIIIERLVATAGRLGASISEVKTVAVNNETALAEFKTATTALIDEHSASIEQTSTAVAGIDEKLAAAWALKLNVDGYISGIEAINDGTTSAFVFMADIFKVVFPGLTPKDVFQIALVDGEPQAVLRANLLADGAVTARSISVPSLTAIQAFLGDATVTGRLTGGPGGRLIQDFTAGTLKFLGS